MCPQAFIRIWDICSSVTNKKMKGQIHPLFMSQWQISLHGGIDRINKLHSTPIKRSPFKITRTLTFYFATILIISNSGKKIWNSWRGFSKVQISFLHTSDNYRKICTGSLRIVQNCMKQLSSSHSQREKHHVWNQSSIKAATQMDDLTRSSILCTDSADKHGSWP